MSELRFLLPAGLLALVSLPLVLLFHMRSPTPRAAPVPSLRFWRVAAPRPTDEPRFRRPPITAQLLIHLAIALLLSLALARPASDLLAGAIGAAGDPRHLIVLLDGSTSMLSAGSDAERSRFDEAKQTARARIDALRPGDAVTLVLFGSRTVTRAASDPGAVDQLARDLTGMAAPGGVADLTAVLMLAGDLRVPGIENRVLLLSDGALSADPAVVSGLGMAIEDLRFGQSAAENVAIVEVTRRNDPANPTAQQVLATVANFSAQPAYVTVALSADGVPVTSRELSLAPEERRVVLFATPRGAGSASIALAPPDSQPLDDVATIQLDAGGGGLNVLIFSDLPDPLARAFGALPGARVTVETTDTARDGMGTSGFDLVVYDQVVPSSAPISPALFVSPPDSDYFRSPAMLADAAIVATDPGDPVMNGVDLSGIFFGVTPLYELPAGFVAPVTAADGPLIAYGRLNGSGLPAALLAMPLDAGNLTQRIAFPILIANLTQQLAPSSAVGDVRLGESLPIAPSALAVEVTVIAPDGRRTTLDVPTGLDEAAASARTIAFTGATLPGVYTIEEYDADRLLIVARRVSINAGSVVESDLRARPGLAETLALATPETGSAAGGSRLADLWPLLAVLALALVVAEWGLSLRAARPAVARPQGGSG